MLNTPTWLLDVLMTTSWSPCVGEVGGGGEGGGGVGGGRRVGVGGGGGAVL